MKIRLLNDGQYGDMDKVKFPVIVEASWDGLSYAVTSDELYRVGANKGAFDFGHDWAFLYGECEVVEDAE